MTFDRNAYMKKYREKYQKEYRARKIVEMLEAAESGTKE
jgi:hypothetical protein